MIYETLSAQVLDAAFAVHRSLGPGLLEQNYHNALYLELRAMGVPVRYNHPYTVTYRNQVVGTLQIWLRPVRLSSSLNR